MGRERTEVRGWDDDDVDIDWPVGVPPPHFPKFIPRPISQQELIMRPFVKDALQTMRCWCGRPIKDSTGTCFRNH